MWVVSLYALGALAMLALVWGGDAEKKLDWADAVMVVFWPPVTAVMLLVLLWVAVFVLADRFLTWLIK